MSEKYLLIEPVVTESEKEDGDWATVPIVAGPYPDYETAEIEAENSPYVVISAPN